jgi:hypothetical protein
MAFFEFYAIGIPMFAPSLKLLTQWHLERFMLSERTWDAVRMGMPASGSVLPRHPLSSSVMHGDPNDDKDQAALLQWLALSGVSFCFCFCFCTCVCIDVFLFLFVSHSCYSRYTR